ncbi:DUF3397 family protein [Levilactobacillus suantsaii]|uniref:DUF3397 family protein n=1 Tax=Levilactobacillus suantsaii TaxID=2292255 RepID=A0A4Q0VIG3_9LACO|nr:DUF3397 family protein [Levilactobacillus suantsaii]QMU07417.1 DUF3397 family protein [Levilactobacillus suantsaii]RXI79218.1 DUF3397 family protein [Levilactobacillus suantsaii]
MRFWVSPGGQLAILLLGWLVIHSVRRLMRHHWPQELVPWDLMTPLLILCSIILIPQGAGHLLPWVVIGWMLIGIGVALLQAVHNHELLYPRFWKTFWRLSDLYWLFGFAACFLLTIS